MVSVAQVIKVFLAMFTLSLAIVGAGFVLMAIAQLLEIAYRKLRDRKCGLHVCWWCKCRVICDYPKHKTRRFRFTKRR